MSRPEPRHGGTYSFLHLASTDLLVAHASEGDEGIDQGRCGKEVGLFGETPGSLARMMLKAALERKVAMLELLRSQDERKAEEGIPPAQARNMREINENLTILLGVTSSQGGDIKVIKEDVSIIKDRLDRLEIQSNEQTALLNEHTRRFDHVEALLTQILARLPEKS